MPELESIDRKSWEEFLEAPVAVLMLGKNDCQACADGRVNSTIGSRAAMPLTMCVLEKFCLTLLAWDVSKSPNHGFLKWIFCLTMPSTSTENG